MLVRVVDYLGSPGGGMRFLSEMMPALDDLRCGARFEIVSHGSVLERYRRLLRTTPADRFRDIRPANFWRTGVIMHDIPGAGPLNWLLRTPVYYFDVPASVFEGCDAVWFPWLSRHRFPWLYSDKVIGTLHDVILLEFDTGAPARLLREERETLRSWLSSSARIVLDANTTIAAMGRLFGTTSDRARVIPLSAQHRRPTAQGNGNWAFRGGPYILCSSNRSPHKNLDVLLAAVGRWHAKIPLVLTGSGTDLWSQPTPRSQELARIAAESGLERNRTLFALGYVDDAAYYELLRGAWAVVIPTLAEGAGLPVLEAMQEGIPVISSDIPIAREMIGLSGGQVLWFDPKDAADLSAKLADLEKHYGRYKSLAVSQVPSLSTRTWRDVAAEYLDCMFPGSLVRASASSTEASSVKPHENEGHG